MVFVFSTMPHCTANHWSRESFHSIDLPSGTIQHSAWLSQLLTSSSSSLSSSPMLHCVWADCCSDRPLVRQFNSQVSECTSSDTQVKCLVFGICPPALWRVSLPFPASHTTDPRQTQPSWTREGMTEGEMQKRHWFWGREEQWTGAEHMNKLLGPCESNLSKTNPLLWWPVLCSSVLKLDHTLINTTQRYWK